jgi:hypothetical protein
MVMNTPKIEGEGERAPDIVRDAVAEDQAQHDDHAPADAPHQLRKRQDQR